MDMDTKMDMGMFLNMDIENTHRHRTIEYNHGLEALKWTREGAKFSKVNTTLGFKNPSIVI